MIRNFKIKVWWDKLDKINYLLILILAFFGIILSFSLSEDYSFLNRHLIFSLIGLILMTIISNLDIKFIRRISLLGVIFFIIMLALILLLDYETKGSKRWLRLFSFSLQPSEFIKPFFLIITAWCLSQSINGRKAYLGALLFLFVSISSLTILQPDLGMTLLISISFFCQLFVAGLSFVLVIISIILIIILGLSSYFIFDHVQKRIRIFLDSSADTYQIDLSLKAFNSGGLFGKGPGQGILKERIPDVNTDFIFAVAGEELGFVFCSIIILLILIIVLRSLLNSLKLKDPNQIIAIVGLVSSFGIQSLINIFSALGLIPTKGMTLPFVSYGGSSMISSAILFGFLLALTKKNNE